MDISFDIDIDMDADSEMAVSRNWRSFQGSHRAPLKGFGVGIDGCFGFRPRPGLYCRGT